MVFDSCPFAIIEIVIELVLSLISINIPIDKHLPLKFSKLVHSSQEHKSEIQAEKVLVVIS